MSHALTRLFTAHPARVGESYFGHMHTALTFAFWLLVAGLAALVHALLPWLFERTASDISIRLHSRMMRRR